MSTGASFCAAGNRRRQRAADLAAPTRRRSAGACLCWAIDNNLTRPVSGGDPVQIAAIKGVAAGAINTGLALWLGLRFPAVLPLLASGLLGFVGYGLMR
ncbi:hypothetical protein B1A_12008 [mine drainage metagenome]|uniref:Uncharacterized protein n=1 Tax=mine drainage metagenome TaxID=410659 RepID=T1CKN2_9ZZZZ